MRQNCACCHDHTISALDYMSLCEAVKIVRIDKPNEMYTCSCGAPANWSFKEVKP